MTEFGIASTCAVALTNYAGRCVWAGLSKKMNLTVIVSCPSRRIRPSRFFTALIKTKKIKKP